MLHLMIKHALANTSTGVGVMTIAIGILLTLVGSHIRRFMLGESVCLLLFEVSSLSIFQGVSEHFGIK